MVLEAGIAHQSWWMVGTVLLVSLLTFIPLMRIWFEAFWKPAPVSGVAKPDTTASVTDSALSEGVSDQHPNWRFVPVLGLSATLLVIGLNPSPLIELADKAASGVLDVNPYIEIVLGTHVRPSAGTVEIKP